MLIAIVCLSKGGGTQILKISERGEPEKNLRWGKLKGGKIFKMKGGNPTFQVEFWDTKGQKWVLWETN